MREKILLLLTIFLIALAIFSNSALAACVACPNKADSDCDTDFTKCDKTQDKGTNTWTSYCMKCSGAIQAAGCGFGQGLLEADCGAETACDGLAVGATCETGKTCDSSGKCVATATGKVDSLGQATACNGNVAYNIDTKPRYDTWNGNCDGNHRQLDGSGGIGQGCCEQACGAPQECDEQYAGQGNCDSSCRYLLNCLNQISSQYGNRLCRDNVDVSNCNWPDNSEKVEKTETSNGVWQVTFSSTAAVDVNVFVVYGRITSVTQPDWKSYGGYIKPTVCPQDSSETTCNPQLIGTHNYCSFRSGSSPMMVNKISPSVITTSNPARGFWPLPLSSSHTAVVTINATDEARRRGIPVILYYQFNKAISIPNNNSWCAPGTACAPTECGTYTGCFENSISASVELCVKTQDAGGLNIIPACGHYAWESQLWNKVSLLSTVQESGLSCSYCEAGMKCSCTVSGCSVGNWILRNLTSPAAVDSRTSIIPPATIEFTPSNSGFIEVTADCLTPQFTQKVNVDVKPKFLSCPANCYTNETCACQIFNCSAGTVTAMKDGLSIKYLQIPPITTAFSFNSSSAGTVTVTGICSNPAKTMTASVTMSQKPTNATTTTAIELKECPYGCCKYEAGYKEKGCSAGQECNNKKCEDILKDCPDEYKCCNMTGYKIKSCSAGQTCNKKECEGGDSGGSMLMLAIIIIAVLVAAYFLYFFVLKKKTKVTFDSLYQKWPAKPQNY